MTIDRVVLHGTPGDAPGTMRVQHLPRGYEGPAALTFTLRMTQMTGITIRDIDVHYVYLRTDEHGVPHYWVKTRPGLAPASYGSHSRPE